MKVAYITRLPTKHNHLTEYGMAIFDPERKLEFYTYCTNTSVSKFENAYGVEKYLDAKKSHIQDIPFEYPDLEGVILFSGDVVKIDTYGLEGEEYSIERTSIANDHFKLRNVKTKGVIFVHRWRITELVKRSNLCVHDAIG